MNDDQYKKIFSRNLRRYMSLNDKNQTDLIRDLGFNKSAVSTWCNGTRLPRMDKVDALAKYFNIKRSDLIEDHSMQEKVKTFDNIFPISVKKFPLLGEISCGEPIFANEDRENYVLTGTDIDADFCLKAKGDSMIGARIFDGDIVFIKKTDTVNDGEVAAVIIDDEVLLKRFYYFRNENLLTLQSENPKYPPKSYTGEQLDHIRVLGKAVAFQSDII